MKKRLILTVAISIFTVACVSEQAFLGNGPAATARQPVPPSEISALLCGAGECPPEVCEEVTKCPIGIALSNRVLFEFIKTFAACEGCNTPDFPPEKGIGKCVEYEITESPAEWTVIFRVSENCSFRYSEPSRAEITATIGKSSFGIERLLPAEEYINDPKYCRVDEDCRCLSGSGVMFIGCSNFLYAPLNWSGYYSGDACICGSHRCREA
jgi:hypothetical protein